MTEKQVDYRNPRGFQERLDLRHEVLRKLVHLFGLILPAGYVYFGPPLAKRLMLLGVFVVIGLDLIRLYWPPARRIYGRLFSPLNRATEEHRLTGSSLLILAQSFTAFVFPSEIVPVAMTFGIVGDTAAALIGKSIGGPKWRPNKTVSGTTGSIVVSFFGGLMWMTLPWHTVLIGATAAALAEGLVTRLDDNLVMPVVGGVAMWVVVFFSY